MNWVSGLYGDGTVCGLTDGSIAGDWRLPTRTEWMAMVAYAKQQKYSPVLTNGIGDTVWTEGHLFNNVQSALYFSSTTDSTYVWAVDMQYGFINRGNIGIVEGYVWPVRGGQPGAFDSLPGAFGSFTIK
jgi:hypothetical protein